MLLSMLDIFRWGIITGVLYQQVLSFSPINRLQALQRFSNNWETERPRNFFLHSQGQSQGYSTFPGPIRGSALEMSALSNEYKVTSEHSVVTKKKKKKIPLRRWNLNRDGSPFGFDLNAEVWNGRVAQISFVWVFAQELFQGKGVLQSIAEEDIVATTSLGLFFISMIGLLGRFLAEPDGGVELGPDYLKPDNNIISLRKLFDPAYDPTSTEPTWNFNDGRSPFGLKKNAEIWNGRLAQASFIWLFVQEFFQGQGVIGSIEEGNPWSLFFLMVFTLSLTGLLGIVLLESNKDDFVERVVGKDALDANSRIFQGTKRLNAPYTPASALTKSPSTKSVESPSSTLTRDTDITSHTVLDSTWEHSYAASLRAMTASDKTHSNSEFDVLNSMHSNSRSSSSTYLNQNSLSSIKVQSPELEKSEINPYTGVSVNSPKEWSTSMNIATRDNQNVYPIELSYSASQSYLSRLSPRNDIDFLLLRKAQSVGSSSSYLESLSSSTNDETDPAYDESRWSFELAELWNGRFAQMAFVIVFAQEMFQGKGIIQGIVERDPINLISLVGSLVMTAGITILFVDQMGSKSSATKSTIHPDVDFKFNRRTERIIKGGDGIVGIRGRREPVFPVSSASSYPVEKFSFKPRVQSMVKADDQSPHPSGQFRFNEAVSTSTLSSTIPTAADASQFTQAKVEKDNQPKQTLKVEPRTNIVKWPVQGYKFPEDVRSFNELPRSITQGQPLSHMAQEKSPIITPHVPAAVEVLASHSDANLITTVPNSLPMNSARSYLDALGSQMINSALGFDEAMGYKTSEVSSVRTFSSSSTAFLGSYLESLSSNVALQQKH